MIVKIFDDLKSFFHFLLGFLVPFWGAYGLIIVVIYFLYQCLEKEKRINKIGDFIEFLTGAGGWALVHTLMAIL